MPTHLLNRRLAAHASIRNIETTIRADRAADAAEAAVRRVWRDVLAILRNPAGWHHDYIRARSVLHRLNPEVAAVIGDRLYKMALWSHREAAKGLAATLPLPYLRAASPVPVEAYGTGQRLANRVAAGLPVARGQRARIPFILGNVPEGLHHPLGTGGLLQLIEVEREPSRQPQSEDAQRAAFQALLFSAPSEGQVHRIIYAGGWREQLQQATRLGDPDRLARVLADGIAAGKTQRQIAKDLLPHVDGVKVTARRLARTYGMAVAHRVQFEMHEANADLIDGYQVHSAGGHNARHNHALRSGTIYHRNPKPGQRGFDQMPHPPFDEEDPPFTHRELAHNCRCWTSPVMSPPEHVTADPVKQAVFTTNAGDVVPDPAHYSDWFDQADERRRRLAVGTRRYSLVRDLLGQEPGWTHFIGEGGELLSMAELKAETDVRRSERVGKVRSIIAELRRLIQAVATWGFLPRMGA